MFSRARRNQTRERQLGQAGVCRGVSDWHGLACIAYNLQGWAGTHAVRVKNPRGVLLTLLEIELIILSEASKIYNNIIQRGTKNGSIFK